MHEFGPSARPVGGIRSSHRGELLEQASCRHRWQTKEPAQGGVEDRQKGIKEAQLRCAELLFEAGASLPAPRRLRRLTPLGFHHR